MSEAPILKSPPMPRAVPARPRAATATGWLPIGMDAARLTGGFWFRRQEVNGRSSIATGRDRLEEAGNLEYFRIASGRPSGMDVSGKRFVDAQVYKWLEAVAWEYARRPDPELLTMQREVTELVAAAQCEDGYLNAALAVGHSAQGRYFDLSWSHEHFCAGHLFQAAIAQVRCTGDQGLLGVAVRFADHLADTFGEEHRHDVDGHPLVEMALVELYRETGTMRYLELAKYFVEARGHGLIAALGKDPAQSCDRVPVREAVSVEGHAVKAVYLAAGATDVATELCDKTLLDALSTQFAAMWSTKAYLTGGLGSRWEGEAFGEPYELPPDRAYAETCAAIGGIQWAWRLLLATGDSRYADAIERMLFNGFLAGVSLSGSDYFYLNPLHLREGATPDTQRSPAHGRRKWFETACCPPNVMRTLASLATYMASGDDNGIQLHQYGTGEYGNEALSVRVETDYPWDGRVVITVQKAREGEMALAIRIPSWAEGAELTVAGEGSPAQPGCYETVTRRWARGDTVILTLPMRVRYTFADPRIESIAGQVALERGPLVYAVEQADQTRGTSVDMARLVPDGGHTVTHHADLLGGVSLITAAGQSVDQPPEEWPYPAHYPRISGPAIELVAIPYYAWANRHLGAMRVWFPCAKEPPATAITG